MLQLQFKFELTLTHSKSVFLVKVAILDLGQDCQNHPSSIWFYLDQSFLGENFNVFLSIKISHICIIGVNCTEQK